MKTNVSLELDDQDRNTLANFIDGKKSARLATRTEVVEVSRSLVTALIDAQVKVSALVEAGTRDGVLTKEVVIKDINDGGWSMLAWD